MHQFLILGGDSRQICLNRLLSQSGARTLFYYDRPSSPFSLREAMEDSHIILCPVPFTKDGKTIFSENSLPGLEIQALADCLKTPIYFLEVISLPLSGSAVILFPFPAMISCGWRRWHGGMPWQPQRAPWQRP